MFKKIKYFIQRGMRGYSDEDTWSFDDYLCEIIPPALRKLAKNHCGCGCPTEFWDSLSKNNECHKWAEALETMAQGFESAQSLKNMSYYKMKKHEDGSYTREIDEEMLKNLNLKYNAGILLFSKNFLSLWD